MREDMPRKRWSRKVIALVLLVIIVGSVALYLFIVDPLIHYERLELFSKGGSYLWIANSKGQVTLADLRVWNSGTKQLAIDKVWVNGMLVNASDVRYYLVNQLPPNTNGELFIFPRGFIFQDGQNYNLTIGTASGGLFTFVLPVDNAHKKQENLTVTGLVFLVPPDMPNMIVVKAINGPTRVFITQAWVNGTEATIGIGRIEPGGQNFEIECYFHFNSIYVVRFQTATGNIYEFTATAIQP